MPVSQFGTIYVWKGAAGGDWSDNVHNWTPGYPAASAPGYGDLAIFNDGGADSVAGNGAASELDVVLGTTLTIQDSVSTDGAVTGVGLMVDSGGTVIVGSGAAKQGVPTSPGTVSVDDVGFMGVSALDVIQGGGVDDTGLVLGDRSTGSGTLTVDGAGSQVIVGPAAAPNGLLIIGNAGTGEVTVQNSGSLSAVMGAVLGFGVGSTGTATLTGSGSGWFAASLAVGQGGTGSIAVGDGGVLTTFNTGIGGAGTIDVSATLLGNAGTVVAFNTITMSGGTLDVTQGGVVLISSSASTGAAGSVLIDAGRVLSGLGTINGNVALSNQGTLLATGVAPGVLALHVTGDISGGGTMEPLMTLDLNGMVVPGVQIVFHDPTLLEPGVLILEDAAAEDGTISGFAEGNEILIPGGSFTNALLTEGGTISGFAAGNTIEIADLEFTTAVFTQGSLGTSGTLVLSGGTEAPLALAVAGGYAPTDFIATPGAFGGTTVTLAPCFAVGTRIATPAGEVAVEALRIGDRVLSVSGEDVPVRWLGYRRVDCRGHPRPQDVRPVRVRTGAFAPGVPARDLLLSPDHAVFANGSLVPVRYLINGRSIVQEAWDGVTYWHVELERHDVLLAEGLACESYLDTGNRGAFANGGTVVQAHPEFSRHIWATRACAPLVVAGAALTEVRRGLLARAAALGHVGTRDPALHAIAAGWVLRPEIAGRTYRFQLPRGAGVVRLRSRSAVPAEVEAEHADHRRLGVAVAGITLGGSPLALCHPAIRDGWHDAEAAWRWTNGDAGLAVADGGLLEVEVAMTPCYWAEAPLRSTTLRRVSGN